MERTPNSQASPALERQPRRWRGDEGAALVEGAIVAPIIVFLIFGLLEMSMFLQTHMAVKAAIADATREVSLSSETADQAAINQLILRSAGSVSSDIERVVIYSPESVGDGPAEDCRNGGATASCQSFSATDLAAGTIGCSGAVCADGREQDSLVGIWISVRYSSVTGLIPDSVITAQHVQRVSPEAVVGG